MILDGRVLCGLDVAWMILALVRCKHLKLEQLAYLAYADYLCKTGQRLFRDPVYASGGGPIVSSIYDKFYDAREKELPSKLGLYSSTARIMFAADGLEKVQSIRQTITKYGDLHIRNLLKITCGKDSPWSKCNYLVMYSIIPDDLIKKFHLTF